MLLNFQQLHEMFKDLALMVEQQGEMLNNIEKNVDLSVDYVAQAEKELIEAKKHVDTGRKVSSSFFAKSGVSFQFHIFQIFGFMRYRGLLGP